MKNRITKEKYFEIIGLLLIFLLTFIIVYRQSPMEQSDYNAHANWATMLFPDSNGNQEILTYPLWHFFVWVGYNLLGGRDLPFCSAFVTAIFNGIVYGCTVLALKKYKIKYSAIFSLILCINTAIYLPWFNEHIFLGQDSPVTWHNPTNLAVKPFVILAFFLIVQMIEDYKQGKTVTSKEYWILSGLILFSTLAKPSFFQGIVPGLGVYLILFLIYTHLKQLQNIFSLCLTFIPGSIIVLFQFYVSFYTGDGEGIGIGWLVVNYSPNMLVSLCLLLCFPVSYLLLHFKSAVHKTSVQLAWIYWLMSWLESALLYEKGSRMWDGNFGWAVLLADTILFLVTACEYLRDVQQNFAENKRIAARDWIIGAIWMLHFISGCIYAWQMATIYNGWVC